jgi:inorganic pyrophosphatase/exopolyphosphatase
MIVRFVYIGGIVDHHCLKSCSFNAKMFYAIICIIDKTRALLQKNIACIY